MIHIIYSSLTQNCLCIGSTLIRLVTSILFCSVTLYQVKPYLQIDAIKKSCFSIFSVMETTYADSWSDIARSCDIVTLTCR